LITTISWTLVYRKIDMDLAELLIQVGGGGGVAWFIVGAIKTAFGLPKRTRALTAIVVGAAVGIALAFIDGGATATELVAGAFAGIAAVGVREGFTAATGAD
jgi:hypothetical protein